MSKIAALCLSVVSHNTPSQNSLIGKQDKCK